MWRIDRGIEKLSAAYISSWFFFFHFAYHRLWRGSMSLEVFMILFDVSFLFDSDVELTSILSYSMHIVTQSRCSLLFVSAADGDLCHTKGPRLLRMAQYLGYCEVWQEWSSHDCSYCPHLRELMADVHVKMISGCTNDRWLYAEIKIWVCMHLSNRIFFWLTIHKFHYKRAYQYLLSLCLSLSESW